MKSIQSYRCEVDLYRNGFIARTPKDRLYSRSSQGVYIVAAKSAKEARQLLQQHIRFGSITIPKYQYVPEQYQNLAYKEILKIR